jgi:predicted membrane-bound spermidine synthase
MSRSSRPQARAPSGAGRAALHLTVAVAGAAVMILELVGTRIIGPFYGVSLYVWTALIAVTLIALALGYWLGGVLAERAPAFGLAHALGAAGLLCAAVPPAAHRVLLATDALGLRAGAFCSALLLFLLPLAALGTVGPLAIQSLARGPGAAGRVAGSVLAVSTAGSVAGTLLFGFFLLPALGSRAILLGLGGALLLLAALHLWIERGPRWRSTLRSLAGLAALTALPSVVTGDGASAPGRRVIFDEEGIHGRVRVIDDERGRLRWLLSDASTISSIDLDTGECPFGYLRVLAAVPDLRPQADRALLVGVGGGILARAFSRAGLPADCIELDPAVAQAARTCFGFRPDGEQALGDARYILRTLHRRYDVVVHDCFTGGAMPAHLLSVEALRDVKRCMTADAVLALNVVGATRRGGSRALAAVRASLGAVFADVEAIVLDVEAPVSDVIFLASDGPLDREAIESVAGAAGPDASVACARDIPGAPGLVLTDDFNPLDVLQAPLSESYRELLVARMGLDILGR